MKLKKLFFAIVAILMATGAFGQRVNRGDICEEIPGLTLEQQKKIDGLSVNHQKKMDQLRTQFYAERNSNQASALKREMNTEMKNHFRNISAQLNTEQQVWFNQHCYADGKGAYYVKNDSQTMGRNSGRRLGRGSGNGTGRGAGRGSGRGMGRGMGPCYN